MRHQPAFLLFCALFTAGCPLDLSASRPAVAGGVVQEGARAREVVGEIRVHGNHATTDDEVIRLSGVQVGAAVDDAALVAVRERLESTGRFARVEVRRRYRSLDDPLDVAIVIIVEEHPIDVYGVPVLNPVNRALRRLQYLPVLNYQEGYGVTYGVRVSLAEPFGSHSRLSVPLTWGGTRQAAAVLEREFGPARASRVEAGVGITRREHPFYDVADRRTSAWARVGHTLASAVTIGARVDRSDVRFGEADDEATSFGLEAALDLRQDPLFPRNTIYVSAAWEHLDPASSDAIERRRLDARAYAGLVGQSVLAVRALYDGSGDATPPWRKPILGGGSSLRGHRVGAFAGDSLLATSVELRLPLNSPLRATRTGVDLFFDAGKVQDAGASLSDARWERGAGVGVFLLAPFIQLNLDVGRNLRGGGTRWHFAAGARF
jgi:outer membrane protein assembly factor BamA